MEFDFIQILILLIGVYLLFAVMKLDGRMKGIRYTLDQISEQVGLPEKPVNNELRQLLHEGNDVQAVKKARETLGLSLIEAKQYVDDLKFTGK